jgi:cyclase
MSRIGLAALAGASLAFATSAYAQQQVDWDKVQIKTTDFGHDTYMLEGQGGNITVAVGTDGLIMVDTTAAAVLGRIGGKARATPSLSQKAWRDRKEDGKG